MIPRGECSAMLHFGGWVSPREASGVRFPVFGFRGLVVWLGVASAVCVEPQVVGGEGWSG